MAVVFSDKLFQFRMVFPLAFREENQIGPAEGIGRFTQNSAGEDMPVAKGVLSIDEEKVEAVAKAEVLVAVIEEKGVGPVMPNGMAGALHAVGIHQHSHSGKVAGEHEGFVSGLGGVEENRLPVGNHAGWGGNAAGKKLIGQTGEEGFGNAFVPAAKDGHPPSGLVQGAGELFHHGSFARSPHGEVSHADDHDAHGVAAKDGVLIKPRPNPHDPGIDCGQEEQKGLEQSGAPTGRAIQDHIGGELLERFKGFQGHPAKVG